MKSEKKRSKKSLAIVLTVIMVLSVCAVIPAMGDGEPTVTRTILVNYLPSTTANPGDTLIVNIKFTEPAPQDIAPAVLTDELQDPDGRNWTACKVSVEPEDPWMSVFRNKTAMVVWGSIEKGANVNVTYKLTVPTDAAERDYYFDGKFDTNIWGVIAITGDNHVTVEVPDETPPVITSVASSSITTDSATITWDTNENSDSLVKYGTALGVYTEEEYNATDVTAHSIDLTGLSADTTYYYVVNSTDPSDNSAESGEYSFTTAEEEKPDLIVTEITLNCGCLFANESNNINATIKNNGTDDAGAFDVRFAVDGYSEEVRIAGLAAGASEEVTVTDTTIRYADASVTITVIADCDGEVTELNETNNETVQAKTVVNNGYKSKSFAGLPSLVLHEHATINGSIVYTVGNSSKVELAPADTNTTGFDITIPGDATVKTARLYVYWYDSWYSVVHGDADLEVTFDGLLPFTTPDASYTDGKGFGSYNYPKGSYAYDVTSAVSSGTDTYTVTIENTAANTNTTLTGQLLLVVYEDATKPEIEYWITEGCDLLKADSNYCVSPEEAIAEVTFAGTIGDIANKSASLMTVVAQGNEAGTDLSFNAQLWEDVWQIPAGSSKVDIDNRDVTDYLLGNDNVVDFRDTGTQGMQASNAILVVEEKPLVEEYTFTVDFVTGYNMITMPLDDPSVITASTLANKIGINCTEIVKWNSTTQEYVSYIPTWPVNNFAIVGGEGYFVNVNNPTSVEFCGEGWNSPFDMSFVTGYNMMGMPVNDTSVTDASSLATKVGDNCTEIVKWNSTTQEYVSYIPGWPVNNFAITGGEGYLVNADNPTDVTFEGEAWQN